MSIVDTLSPAAARYEDKSRRSLLGCFDQFYATLVALIPFEKEALFRVLDLGAGTGLPSDFILREFPNCNITLLDAAEDRLQKAMQRFAGRDKNLRFYCSDFLQNTFPETDYDLIVSSLALHHCSTAQFSMMLSKIYAALKPGGLFIHADQHLGANPEIESIYQQQWINDAKKNGASEADIHKALQRMKENNTQLLNVQLNLMQAKGFVCVNNWYQYFRFCIYSGVKPEASFIPNK